jgi:hypothetical protein
MPEKHLLGDIIPEPQIRPQDAYTLSTPYGLVTIANGGRSVTFELFSDVKQSVHNTALFGYLQRLRQHGVTRYNSDHIHIRGRDRTLDLVRGKARLDLVYESKGRIIECELKTRRELGLETTALQLKELIKYCERLQLLVPRGCLDEAATILGMLGMDGRITIVPYDYLEESD